MSTDLEVAVVALLRSGQQICMDCDLACYPISDGFVVDYLYSEETIDSINLSEKERKTVMDEEELVEYFETPEDAAVFYLKLSNGKLKMMGSKSDKRTITEKLKAHNKEKYF